MSVKKLSLQCAEVVANRDEFVFASDYKGTEKEFGIKRIKDIFITMLQNPLGARLVQKLHSYKRTIFIKDGDATGNFMNPKVTTLTINLPFQILRSSYECPLVNLNVRSKLFFCDALKSTTFEVPKDVVLFHELRHCLNYLESKKRRDKRVKKKDKNYDNAEEKEVIMRGALSERKYLQENDLPYRNSHKGIDHVERDKSNDPRASELICLLDMRAWNSLKEFYCTKNGAGLNELFEDLKRARKFVFGKSFILEFLCLSFINVKELQQLLKNEENIEELFRDVSSVKDIKRLKKLLNYIGKDLSYCNSKGENVLFYLDPKADEYENLIKYIISSYPKLRKVNKFGKNYKEANKFDELNRLFQEQIQQENIQKKVISFRKKLRDICCIWSITSLLLMYLIS